MATIYRMTGIEPAAGPAGPVTDLTHKLGSLKRAGAIVAIVLLAYVIMGTFLEGFAMLVLTLPIVFPLIVQLGFDPIWFGVVMVIVLEMGLISLPVGVCLAVLVAFPQIALILPNSMFN